MLEDDRDEANDLAKRCTEFRKELKMKDSK